MVSGFLAADSVTATYSRTAGTTVAGSPYVIMVTTGTLSAVSYDFTFVNGNLIVTQAVLTVSADNQTKVYGADVPALTVSYSGFANGEGTNVLSGTPDISTTILSNSAVVGSPYAIIVTNGTLAADNYSFTFVDGAFTVTPVPDSVSAHDRVSRTFATLLAA